MDQTAMLSAAIASLFSVLTTFAGAVIKYLLSENKALREKVDASSKVMEKQSETLERQTDSQAKLIDAQQAMIAILQHQSPPKP